MELVERRTATSKTFAGDRPGQFKTELYAGVKHYRDAKGNWVDIDPALGASKDGKRHNNANSFDLAIADSAADASLAIVAIDAGHAVGFALEGAAKVQGKADKASVTYANTHKDTDVRLTSGRTGLKDELILKSPAAPDRFVFPLNLKGLSASIDASGEIVYKDEKGVERARTPHGFMTDAAIDKRSGEAQKSWGVTYALIPYMSGQAIEVRIDRAWLNDPARVWPVTVDPEIKTGANPDDTYVSSLYNYNHSYEGLLGVGTYNGGADKDRAYIRFDTTPLNGATVSWAALVMAERSSADCNRQPGPVYQVTSNWDGRSLLWGNQPGTGAGYAGVMAGMNACPNRSGVWEITPTVAQWAAGTANYGLSVRADETDSAAWKTWSSTEGGGPPRLDVTYNHAPAAPTDVRPINGGRVVRSSQATATYRDTDPVPEQRTSGLVGFLVQDQSNNVQGGSWIWSPYVCSGCTATVTLPALVPETWFKLTAIAFDGQQFSAATGPTWFWVDARPPNVPTEFNLVNGSQVSNPIAVSARYSEPLGIAGNLIFWVNDTNGQFVTWAWKPAPVIPPQNPDPADPLVCNGCIGSTVLPDLAPGTYDVYAFGYDGDLSPIPSPRRITVVPPVPTVSASPHVDANAWYGSDAPTFFFSVTGSAGAVSYSYILDNVATTTPDTTSEGSATSKAYSSLPSGTYWFHVRAGAGGVWGAAAHRRIQIDATAPVAPASVDSSTHTANVPTTNRIATVSWPAGSDALSGVAGYATAFNHSSTETAGTAATTTALTETSSSLGAGTWWFHVRTIDGAGNASADRTFGPIEIAPFTTTTTIPPPLQPPPGVIQPVPPIDHGGPYTPVRVDNDFTPPAAPNTIDPPLTPAQDIVDAVETGALEALAATEPGFVVDGVPDLDPNKLQPQVGSAQLLATTPATLQETIDAIANLQIPPPLPIDPLALFGLLPDFLPSLTYRLCSESANRMVSCSISVPLATPQLVDVTGDGTVDVLADLLPAVSLDAVLATATETLVNVNNLLGDTQNLLQVVLDAIAAGDNSQETLAERDSLEAAVADLLGDVGEAATDVVNALSLGLGLVVLRLPSSETVGGPLPAHVWAVYDLPGSQRLSVGLDGYRRGDSLPDSTQATFTLGVLGLALPGLDGMDVRAGVHQSGAHNSLAVTVGLAGIGPAPQGAPIDPTVLSAQFSPVPAVFQAHGASKTSEDSVTIDTVSTAPSALDAVIVTKRAGTSYGRFTQVLTDQLPVTLSAKVVRDPEVGVTNVEYNGAAVIDSLRVTDVQATGTEVKKVLVVDAEDIPTQVVMEITSVAAAEGAELVLDYESNTSLATLGVGLLDRPNDNLAVQARMTAVPTDVRFALDRADEHVMFTANQPLGSGEAVLTRGLGAVSQLAGDHTTLVTNGNALGVSARVSGLTSVDAHFGAHPRGTTRFSPGGQQFVAAGAVGDHRAQLKVSDLPPVLSFDVDPVVGRATYEASETVAKVSADYVNTAAGPTVSATVYNLPDDLTATWTLGDQTTVHYEASAAIPRFELFVSPGPIDVFDPQSDHFISTAVTDVPATVDLNLDLSAKRLVASAATPLDKVEAVVRLPFAGRDMVVAAVVESVTASFEANFGAGSYAFRAAPGTAVGATWFAATNHGPVMVPTGQHLSLHYVERTGDMDVSASANAITHLEYSKTASAQTYQLGVDTQGSPFAVDVSGLFAAGGVDDTLLAANAEITNLPTTISAKLEDKKIVFTANGSVGIRGEFRIGKVAALDGLITPELPYGVAVTAKVCQAGPGCAPDTTPICTMLDRCVGALARMSFPRLPTSLWVDLQDGIVSLQGYQGPAGQPLQAYVRLLRYSDGVPDVTAKATFAGLPATLNLTAGPFRFKGEDEKPKILDAHYVASATLGAVTIKAQAETTKYGHLRGEIVLPNAPASADVTGQFGKDSTVHLQMSEPVPTMSLTVSAEKITGNPASAILDLTDVPATIDFTLKDFDSDDKAAIPTITYDGHGASTLDGYVKVEGNLVDIFEAGEGHVSVAGDAWARLTNLGTNTEVRLLENGVISITSAPDTDSLQIGALLRLNVPAIPFNVPVFAQDLGPTTITGTLFGTYGFPQVRADVNLVIEDVHELVITPSDNLTYLQSGLEGQFGRLAIDVSDVFVVPRVEVNIRGSLSTGQEAVQTIHLDTPRNSLLMRLSEQVMHRAECVSWDYPGWGSAHVDVQTLPGGLTVGENRIEILGGGAAKTLTLVPTIEGTSFDDLRTRALVLGVDLLTAYVTAPIDQPAPDVEWSVGFGGC